MDFRYKDGPPVCLGDQVALKGTGGIKVAIVVNVIAPGSDDSLDYHCHDTGGVLVEFVGTTQLELWIDICEDEDVKLLRRGDAH